MNKQQKRGVSYIPGLSISLGFTLFYLSLIVLIPLAALLIKASHLTWNHFLIIILDPQVLMAFKLTFLSSAQAAGINAIFGLLVAWVLVRYSFPGRKFVDSLVDLPFALPTAVAGISLTAVYAPNGWQGAKLASLGIHVAYTSLGVTVALIFIGLPFVVRTVQPVIEDLDQEVEEAAESLGANRWQIFTWIILPALFPALLTGTSLAFARALGEYGSVIFISGNMPYKTEIIPQIIISKLEQFDYAGATAVATVMLVISFLLLLGVNVLQKWAGRKLGA